ncbi:[LysW]-aminoadipate/[LysW]-glutamate kinase [Metallosphaera sp. J1]|uniref:[LysW]-aminoadipate/[LysW]-glutamate kinase n=1 Tax=Metallosphaera TaxID=41980 RepID=UPI001EDE5CC8|nr:[LysW]-aminoadipate/[LysW]-glutamate kinase [Metallosphaera javensis (ex Hofmann et al. 2022)]MCG3109884.1 [LysW]-aminoadipate/[LysW]-glutamate kinase [Metallosphaera javensis (ex Hofmann et al. 2022)]BCS92140.1 MAG: acetylaminoadipate kinase [Metallosphaera javensis (ex Sakai et al. 2022)]
MIVVKIGGRVVKNALQNIVESVLSYQGKMILVHGGGDIVTEYTKRMGMEPTFVTSPEGIRSRYTSREELDVYIMTMGLINKNIVTQLISRGKSAIGITGVDGGAVIGTRKKRIMILDERGKKRIIDGGYTGKIVSVNSQLMSSIASLVDVVVVSPIALDTEEGTPLNVDGDQMAFNVAKAVKAEALLLLSDVDGVLLNGSVIRKLTKEEAKELSMKIGPGMNRKVLMAAESVESGVSKVIIGSGLVPDAINSALGGRGTEIS